MSDKSDKKMKTAVTPVFRASYPNLVEARSMDGGTPKFGLSAIWVPAKFTEQDKKRWRLMLELLDEASQKQFKKAWKDLNPEAYKKGLRDGAVREGSEGYGEGTRFASLTTRMKPGIVDKEGNDFPAGDVYAGCYMRATVNAYGYDNKGKGIALGLMNLQFIGHGARLDSRTNASEDFSDDKDLGWMDNEAAADDGSGF